jgi:hypothetical protein
MVMVGEEAVDKVGGLGNAGSVVGDVAGATGTVVGDFFTSFSLFITRITLVEWVIIMFIVVGGFIVWYLKRRFNLKFRLSPSKPKKHFN